MTGSSVSFICAQGATGSRSANGVCLYDTLALNRLDEVVCWDERGGVGKSTWAPPS